MDFESVSTNKYLIKSRDIPIQDYFSILQIEYISYFIRSKVYRRCEDKKKFLDIATMKKKKIDSFAIKNCLPSIFNGNKNYLQKYFDKFFGNGWGLPAFQYRDSYKKEIYSRYDPFYYFSRGTEVKFKVDEEIILGTITKYYDGICNIVDVNGTKYSVEISNISRILTDGFLDMTK